MASSGGKERERDRERERQALRTRDPLQTDAGSPSLAFRSSSLCVGWWDDKNEEVEERERTTEKYT